ncbi:Lrp/AsnC family transcriptional regulator [Paenibacillus hamazuiensis]|uniref:Lrp/AsnC family transcriptional regulator n=1 Tax=Paenibacillus hamazuiensis TaxID=2936508 RepID=UPI00200D8B50|nr:Lrp/AsnC family transcriptional regulator [Paenibacillus hamazuiensis]
MELDRIDMEIIRLLRENSRIQWKDIGRMVFLTGQAVAGRIKRLEDAGVIRAYTLQVDEEKLGKPLLALVIVFMKSTNHTAFHCFVRSEPAVTEAFRVSGDGRYSLKVLTSGQTELSEFLDRLLQHGNYRVHLYSFILPAKSCWSIRC